jgi:hypothetical protein
MSQFEGGKFKVRCIDCTKLSGSHCEAKNTTISPKKKRLCGQYNFKGEYENSTPAESIYIPHVEKKTLKMLKRLAKLGVLPVSDEGTIETHDGFYKQKTLPIPATTANAELVEIKETEDPTTRWEQDDHGPDYNRS